MTSSFTNLVWAGRSLGLLQSPGLYLEKTDSVAKAGRRLLSESLEKSRLWEDRASGRYSILEAVYGWVRLGNRLSRCWR